MSTKISIALTALSMSAASLGAQVQTIKKLPPSSTGSVATVNLPAPTKAGEIRPITETVDSKIGNSAGLPDLVVREIRHEGRDKFAMRVANEGSLRAGTFALLLEVVSVSGMSERAIVDVPALDGGGEYWVTAEVTEPAKIAKLRAIADVAYVNSKISVDPVTGMPVAGKFSWWTVPSKVTESNEGNNLLEVVPPR